MTDDVISLDSPICALGIAPVIQNGLRCRQIATVRDLIHHTPLQLLDIRNIGFTRVDEIEARLADHGFVLAGRASAAAATAPDEERVAGELRAVREAAVARMDMLQAELAEIDHQKRTNRDERTRLDRELEEIHAAGVHIARRLQAIQAAFRGDQ